MNEWVVSEQNSGQSLQAFLKSKFTDNISAKAIKRSIDAGGCSLNGRVERFSSRLVGIGDKVSFELSERPRTLINSVNSILYSDTDILAINKPSGISSTSEGLLESLEKEFGTLKLLHRLDKETSGVLLFAKNDKMAEVIEKLFKERNIEKTYLAIVDGTFRDLSGTVDNYLGKLKVYEGQTIMGLVSKDEGVRAVTHWQVMKAGKKASLIQCMPKTGRMHQIRVHMAGLLHPILGDYQYGKRFDCQYRPQRLLLHASEISFVHPKNLTKITIKAEIPKDFAKAKLEIIDVDG